MFPAGYYLVLRWTERIVARVPEIGGLPAESSRSTPSVRHARGRIVDNGFHHWRFKDGERVVTSVRASPNL